MIDSLVLILMNVDRLDDYVKVLLQWFKIRSTFLARNDKYKYLPDLYHQLE